MTHLARLIRIRWLLHCVDQFSWFVYSYTRIMHCLNLRKMAILWHQSWLGTGQQNFPFFFGF
ncbi:Bgt-20984 [Blumeria graminis f. sp. tritici]|uniref:Bgt-20984 n=2 Tax=Blumeria graminis f. sp. tritici TaxID=62690 RepID=A0A381L225_BLUGR|nr:Bgt-20984 [Blumeria graminis f. sp. tritici]